MKDSRVRQILEMSFKQHQPSSRRGLSGTLPKLLSWKGVKTQERRLCKDHTAHHSGKKLRYTLEDSAPKSEFSGIRVGSRVCISPLCYT